MADIPIAQHVPHDVPFRRDVVAVIDLNQRCLHLPWCAGISSLRLQLLRPLRVLPRIFILSPIRLVNGIAGAFLSWNPMAPRRDIRQRIPRHRSRDRMEPRRMLAIRIHAIARCVNDGSSPIA